MSVLRTNSKNVGRIFFCICGWAGMVSRVEFLESSSHIRTRGCVEASLVNGSCRQRRSHKHIRSNEYSMWNCEKLIYREKILRRLENKFYVKTSYFRSCFPFRKESVFHWRYKLAIQLRCASDTISAEADRRANLPLKKIELGILLLL